MRRPGHPHSATVESILAVGRRADLPTIGVAITHRRTRTAQPEEGEEITEPEDNGDAIEDDGSHRPQRPGAGGADGDHVGVPSKECGTPPVPHEGHFRVARLRRLLSQMRLETVEPPHLSVALADVSF